MSGASTQTTALEGDPKADGSTSHSREVTFLKLNGQEYSMDVAPGEIVGAVRDRLAPLVGTTPVSLDLISGVELLHDMKHQFPAETTQITLKIVDPHPWAHKTIRLLSVLNDENKWIGPTNTWSTMRAIYDIKNVAEDSIPLTCVPVPSARNLYFLRTERFLGGVHAEGGHFWLGLRHEGETDLLDAGKKSQAEAVPVQFVAGDPCEDNGIFNMKIGESWVGVCEHRGPYYEDGYNAERWLSPMHAMKSDALPVKVVAAIKAMAFQETYDELKAQVSGGGSSAPWVRADVLHPLAHKTIRLLSVLNEENKWIGPTNTWSTMRAIYDIKNVAEDSIPLTCVPVPSEQDTYFLRTERFLGGVHAEGGHFWLGLRHEGETDLLDAGKKSQSEAVAVHFAAHDTSENNGIFNMKIGESWVGVCTHPGPYRQYGYKAERWLSPMHASKADAMPMKLIMAVASETFMETIEDFRGPERDQLDEKYFAAMD